MSRALGRYELLRPLARGGMGEVYLARRRAAGVEKWLVVKRMRPERAGDARFLDLFMREARLSMSLAHQNIVPVFDFGRIDDQVFLAMERVEGKDLGSSITKAGKGLPPLLAAFIAAECCQALDYAHRRKSPDGADLGIVHRDVTPRNVLLSWSGEVKLTDFGIAALAGDTPGKTAGTPAYMAPEQARGEPTDVRADVYSVGMVLREALTGVRPRGGNDRERVLATAQTGALDPWPEGFDSPIKAIVDRATQIDREARYPDARAMLEELDEFIVAERAARKADAPARQLAVWLTELWKNERDEETITNEDIQANHLLSFLDDGPFDVIGTGTQRSMAMTAAEELSNKPGTGGLAAPIVSSQAGVSDARVDAKPETKPESQAANEPRTSRLPWIVLAAVVAGGAAVALALSMRPDDQPEKLPAPPVVAVAADAEPIEPVVELDAYIVPPPAPADAAPADAPPRAKPRGKGQQPVKQSNVPPPATATAKYRVFINAKPWSYFTIDGDPTKYQTHKTLELTPGPHTIHFTGSEHHPADKKVSITVPEHNELKVVVTLDAPAP